MYSFVCRLTFVITWCLLYSTKLCFQVNKNLFCWVDVSNLQLFQQHGLDNLNFYVKSIPEKMTSPALQLHFWSISFWLPLHVLHAPFIGCLLNGFFVCHTHVAFLLKTIWPAKQTQFCNHTLNSILNLKNKPSIKLPIRLNLNLQCGTFTPLHNAD